MPTAQEATTREGRSADAGRVRPADAELRRFLSSLEGPGVAAALVREAGRDRNDVLEADLLVAPADLPLLEVVLASRGYRRRPGWGRRPHRFWVRPVVDRRHGTVDWLKLDVVTDLCFGRWHEVPSRRGSRCLRAREGDRLAPADELGALVLHVLLDKDHVAPVHRHRLHELACGGPAPGCLADLCTGVTTDAGAVPDARVAEAWADLLGTLCAGDWAALEARRDHLRRHLLTGRRAAAGATAIRNRTARRLGRAFTAWAGRGPLVALIGPDGTGKSTLAAHLARSAGLPAAVLYGGTYRSGHPRSSLPGADTARVLARLARTRVAVARHRSRGRLVVLDRHPVQARPAGGDALPFRARARRRLLAATLPPADLYLALDAPPALLHERRPEHDVDQLDRDLRRHRSFVRRTPQAVLVDAAEAPEGVHLESLELVWERAVPVAPGHRRRPPVPLFAAAQL